MDAKKPNLVGNSGPRIPIMVLIYCGKEDIDEELWFQSVYENLPEWAKKYVPQFKIVVINLRKYLKTGFPGKPTTRAWAEALVRTSERSLTKNLDSVFGNFDEVPTNNDVIRNLVLDILEVCYKKEGIKAEEIDAAILKVYKGQEGLEMAEAVKRGFYQETLELGEARGIAKERSERVTEALDLRFEKVPYQLTEQIRMMTDLSKLEKLFRLACKCQTLAEFEAELR